MNPAAGDPRPADAPKRRVDRALLRRWFIAGLVVWIPLSVTLLALRTVVNVLDASQFLIPESLRIPGLGVILSIILVLGTGALVANYIGRQALSGLEALLGQIPLVRSLYGGVKKLAETLFSESSNSLKKVVLVEWPRKGTWTVGFQSSEPLAEVGARLNRDLVTVFVPTAPSPTSGFLLNFPRDEVTVLDMSIEQAMRYLISLGGVKPDTPLPPPKGG